MSDTSLDAALHRQLREVVFPRLATPREAPLRLWIVGCGEGASTYALAVELLAFLGERPFQIFATDRDQSLIDRARARSYDEPVRRRCVFARHELLRDPPYGRMDLVVCLGVLTPLEASSRERARAALHFALRPSGLLLAERGLELGDSAFRAFDAAPNVYARGTFASALRLTTREPELHTEPARWAPARGLDLSRQLDRMLLQHFAPPCLLVDDTLTVLQSRGDVERVFGTRGQGHEHLSAVVGEGLGAPLALLVRNALRSGDVERAGAISRVRPNGSIESFDVCALPLAGVLEHSRTVALTFAPRHDEWLDRPRGAGGTSSELEELREHIAELVGAHARATRQLVSLNDELTVVNDELCAGNEDLQALNEELRTAQEQLLGGNDELSALNEQLALRNRELTQVNSDLSNVFATAEVPVVILDTALRIRRFSNQARLLVNVSERDLGRPLDDLRLEIDAPELKVSIARVIESELATECEVSDHGGRWHRLSIRPYRDAEDRVDGVVISLFDIDALKRTARQAELASQQAERANRAKDDFLATLSHELRSPLHSVLVYTQLLRRDALRGEKVLQAVDAIESGVSLLVQLLDELLDVSRIVSGKFPLRKRSTELPDLVARALEVVAEECAEKQLRVRADLPATLRVSGDALRLQQVVANLLSNAIKFTRPGGSIAVSVGALGGWARLCVRDDGIGIDPAFLPRVFDRFTQGDSTLAREFGGLGLGLHIVRQIVELHGGEVAAASDGADRGAQFTISLPVALEVESTPEPAQSLATPPGLLDGLRILVVDDDRVARTAVTDLLSHAGAEVLSAPSAADALEAVVECGPQLMLCDIAMPGEDGYSLIRRVRALDDPALARIPALALTAFARAADRERALAAGYQDHLAKPVDVDLLMQALSTLRADSSAP
ncbi:MAG TPA: ATP-binding protein [Polyangiales bacterium]|nr:ATP-binding protein [Polyangiales bacterium]